MAPLAESTMGYPPRATIFTRFGSGSTRARLAERNNVPFIWRRERSRRAHGDDPTARGSRRAADSRDRRRAFRAPADDARQIQRHRPVAGVQPPRVTAYVVAAR